MKLYSWNELEKFLKKELENTKHILTFGTFGSLTLEHDVDAIVTKKPGSKYSDFYRELHSLLDSLNKYLAENYNAKLVRFSSFSHEDEVLELAKCEEKDLALHLLVYGNYPQMETQWTPDLESGITVKKIIYEKYHTIEGKKEYLFSDDFMKNHTYDNAFLMLNKNDRINSNYPKEFLFKKMNHTYEFISKIIGLEKPVQVKNNDEIREKFYELVGIIEAKSNS